MLVNIILISLSMISLLATVIWLLVRKRYKLLVFCLIVIIPTFILLSHHLLLVLDVAFPDVFDRLNIVSYRYTKVRMVVERVLSSRAAYSPSLLLFCGLGMIESAVILLICHSDPSHLTVEKSCGKKK